MNTLQEADCSMGTVKISIALGTVGAEVDLFHTYMCIAVVAPTVLVVLYAGLVVGDGGVGDGCGHQTS